MLEVASEEAAMTAARPSRGESYEGWIRERDEDDGRARSHKMKGAQQEQKLGWVSTPSRRASNGNG